MPMTAERAPVWRIRWARPLTWMLNISRQRSSRRESSDGTNGCGSNVRSKVSDPAYRGHSTAMRRKEGALPFSPNVLVLRRTACTRSRSTSRMSSCSSNEKRSDSPSMVPFSAMSALPAKTISVVDSPNPAEQYR